VALEATCLSVTSGTLKRPYSKYEIGCGRPDTESGLMRMTCVSQLLWVLGKITIVTCVPAMQVLFLPASVCLSVCLSTDNFEKYCLEIDVTW